MRKKVFTLIFVFSVIASFGDINTMYAPTLVAPVNNATGIAPNITMDWAPVPGAVYYKVEIDSSSSFTNPIRYTSSYTLAQNSELLFGVTYYWRVKAIGISDSSNWSSVYNFTTIASVNITAPVDSSINRWVSVKVQWTAISGVTFYDFEFDTASTFDSPLLVNGSSAFGTTSAYSGQIAYGLHYFLRMRARHSVDTMDWSSYVEFWTIDTLFLRKPATDTVEIAPGILLQWDYNGATIYEVSLATDSAFTTEVSYFSDNSHIFYSSNDTAVKFNPVALNFNTLYFWRVRGTNIWGTSTWSAVRKLTTTNCADMIEPADGATAVSTLTKFKWTDLAGATHYQIQYDTDNGFSAPASITLPDTSDSYTLTTELSPVTTYYWRLRAIHGADTSAWCTEWDFTTNFGVGVEDKPLDNNTISIFPNPTKTGRISVQLLGSQGQQLVLSLTNMFGQELSTEKHLMAQGTNTIVLDLTSYSNGIYFMRIESAGNTITRKIVINK